MDVPVFVFSEIGGTALRIERNRGDLLAAVLVGGLTRNRRNRSLTGSAARVCIRCRSTRNRWCWSREYRTVAVCRRHRRARLRREARDLELTRIGIADLVGKARRLRNRYRYRSAWADRIVCIQRQLDIGGR